MRTLTTTRPWLIWPSLLGAAFLVTRATTTLAMGASFDTPGDGWRSVWQLGLAAILLAGVARPATLRATVGVVAAVYLVATGLELVDGTQLLGVIPVDMRDRIVHPVLALVALLCLAGDRAAQSGSSRPAAPATG